MYSTHQFPWELALRLYDVSEDQKEGKDRLQLLFRWLLQLPARRFEDVVLPALIIFRDTVLRELSRGSHVVLLVLDGQLAKLHINGKPTKCFDIRTGDIAPDSRQEYSCICEIFDLTKIVKLLLLQAAENGVDASESTPDAGRP